MLTVDISEVIDGEREWDRAVNKFSDRVRGAVQKAVTAGEHDAKATHRYKDQTGLLTSRIRGYIEVSVPGGAVGVLGAFTDYASHVEYGTVAHVIRGNPLLVFKGRDGSWVRTRLVNHPGNAPFQFMAKAISVAEQVLIREIDVGIRELQSTMNG